MRINGKPDNRLLERRSRLSFHYPTAGIIVFIPFYENPTITESKQASLVEYNPLARSGSLFAYTGAKSRRITVEATFTLPHLLNFDMGIDRFRRLVDLDKQQTDQRLFFQKISSPESLNTVGDVNTSLATELHVDWIWKKESLREEEDQNLIGEILPLFADNQYNQLKAVDTLLFFANVLRTSVDNNASEPRGGPPIIHLTHGGLYQNVPCICRSYNLGWVEDGGYDLPTLTPRRLKITLNLSETRTNMNTPGKDTMTAVERSYANTLKGWESVINEPFTTDPGSPLRTNW